MTENIKFQIVHQVAIRIKKHRKKGDKRKVFN